jgi:hypothetical protein
MMMKASLFQLVTSSVVLGLMAGLVGFKWFQLKNWDEPSPDGQVDYALVGEWGSEMVMISDTEDLAPPISLPASVLEKQETEATITAFREIVSALQSLKEENEDLREQVKGLNTDMNGIRFNMDTQSGSLRRLKLDGSPARPLEVEPESDDQHPLLPPKPRH